MGLKSIFREGMKERRRKKTLRSEKNEFKSKEKRYAGQLTALGKKAWEAKTDISAFGDLRSALSETQKALDDLQVQVEDLQEQKKDIETSKSRENDRFAASLKETEEKKSGVDRRLNEEKNVLQAGQKETQKAESRLAAIGNERLQLQKKTTAAATTDLEKTAIPDRLAALGKEEVTLKNEIKARVENGTPLYAQIAALQEESAQLQKQLDSIHSEQKKAVAELDQKIASLDKALTANVSKRTEAEKTLNQNFFHLGEKLAAASPLDQNLAKEISAAQNVKAEMEGIQALIGGLERQKDESQVSAYKKMVAITIAGAAMIVAIIILLFILLSPKDKGTPLSRLFDQTGTSAKDLQDMTQQMEKGLSGIKTESEKIQGKKIIAAAETTLKAALPSMAGWQLENPSYGRGAVGELETAHLQADYTGPESRKIHVNITDAGGASMLLVPVKMLFAMKITIDNEERYQKVSVYNNIPVAERYDKRSLEASFAIIVRDRYLIELKTKAENGLELLKEFMDELNLSPLQ